MGELLRSPNGNTIVLTPRSGSHSLALAAIQSFWPDSYQEYLDDPYGKHPAWFFPVHESYSESIDLINIGIIVRDPIERFKSMVAHRPDISLEEHLNSPIYPPLPKGNFTKYFRFEDQLQECAYWLGIESILEKIDPTEDGSKPALTPEQENIIRNIYKDDILLWENLNA